MAARPADAWDADNRPRVVGDIIAVRAEDVDATGRLREPDMAWATALGAVMVRDGQETPITVVRQATGKPWRLIAGGHRLAAALMFPELNPLQAIEREGSALALRLQEIAENVWRKDLDPLDRAKFIAEMHDVLRAKASLPANATAQEIAASARWKKALKTEAGDASAIVAHAYGFSSLIADQLKLSRRTIVYDLMLARRLAPGLGDRIRHLALYRNGNQLRALAKLEQAEQATVVDALLDGSAKSVAGAIALMRGRPKPNDEERRLSTFIGTFARMGVAEKKGALAQLAGMLPAGWSITAPATGSVDPLDVAGAIEDARLDGLTPETIIARLVEAFGAKHRDRGYAGEELDVAGIRACCSSGKFNLLSGWLIKARTAA